MGYRDDRDPYKDLYDSIGKTVDSAYSNVSQVTCKCNKCGKWFSSKELRPQCPDCNSYDVFIKQRQEERCKNQDQYLVIVRIIVIRVVAATLPSACPTPAPGTKNARQVIIKIVVITRLGKAVVIIEVNNITGSDRLPACK